MSVIFKVGSLGVLTLVINNVLIAAGKKDIAFLVDLVCIVTILSLVVVDIVTLFNTVKTLFML